MTSRTWIKLYCDKWLSGSLREESPEIRGIWADLLALAGGGLYGDSGEIKLQNGIGLTDFQFQKLLNISKYQWRKAKKRLLDTQRITVDDLNIIRIINWKRYQSEYERQKPYRNQKLQSAVTQEIESKNKNKIENKKEIYSKTHKHSSRNLKPRNEYKSPEEHRAAGNDDSNKYIKGKYGHMVRR
jgi:hypothetical protein